MLGGYFGLIFIPLGIKEEARMDKLKYRTEIDCGIRARI